MTDYTQYLAATTKTVGTRSMIDQLLDRLPGEAADAARAWLFDPSIDHSHCARAITAMARDLLDADTDVKSNVVARWRGYHL